MPDRLLQRRHRKFVHAARLATLPGLHSRIKVELTTYRSQEIASVSSPNPGASWRIQLDIARIIQFIVKITILPTTSLPGTISEINRSGRLLSDG